MKPWSCEPIGTGSNPGRLLRQLQLASRRASYKQMRRKTVEAKCAADTWLRCDVMQGTAMRCEAMLAARQRGVDLIDAHGLQARFSWPERKEDEPSTQSARLSFRGICLSACLVECYENF